MKKICLVLLLASMFIAPAYAGSDMSLVSPYFPARVNDLPGLFYSLFTATQTYFIPVSAANPLPTTGSFSIASATINSVQPYITTTGVASSSQMDSKGSLNVNIASQTGTLSVAVTNQTTPFVTSVGVASSAKLSASGSLNVEVTNQTTTTPPFVTPAGVASSAQMDASGSLHVNLASSVATLAVTVGNNVPVTITNNLGPVGVATDPIIVSPVNVSTAPIYIRDTMATVGSPTRSVMVLSTTVPTNLAGSIATFTGSDSIRIIVHGEVYSSIATTTAATLWMDEKLTDGTQLTILPMNGTYNMSFISSSTAVGSLTVFVNPLR